MPAREVDNSEVLSDNARVEDVPDRLVIVKDDLQSFIGTSGALLVCVTRRPPTLSSIEVFRDALREHHANYPGTMELVIVLNARRPRLTQGVRTKIIDLWTEFGSKSAVAVMTGGDTLASALRRKFIEAVALLRIRKTPFRVVASPAEAVGWFNALDEDEGKRFDRTGWVAAIERAIQPVHATSSLRRASPGG